ncbi:dihydrolipoamide acetyltransferase family protein [Aliiglaciecola sp. SL4]|uniref:dihydrolipoamide acetyltransferase family protein n=1 Tax=Aliiglaciecola sp. SL4 TaxID=3239806 RepID=UPI00355AEF52
MQNHLIIPNLSESGDDIQGTIVGILMEVGDVIQEGDTVLEIETDKVTVEIPSTYSGTVDSILVNIDQEVSEGVEFATITALEPKVEELKIEEPKIEEPTKDVNVTLAIPSEEKSVDKNKLQSSSDEQTREAINTNTLPASPSTRRLARKLGINLEDIKQAPNTKRISTDDVKLHAKNIILRQPNVNDSSSAVRRPLPDVEAYGPIERQKVSKMTFATSANMTYAWSQIPHAWLQQDIDITDLENWRKSYKEKGGSLTITVILAKALAAALRSFPKFNSIYDEENSELIYKQYYDVGIAVDTPQGLVVPSLRSVDSKGLDELSSELKTLSKKAIDRKLLAKDMQGAGITLSNLGGIGLTSIFPIVNWPQVAILGIAASEELPKYINDQICKRRIMKVTLGFDHRIINGAEGARFLVHLKDIIEDIRLLLV